MHGTNWTGYGLPWGSLGMTSKRRCAGRGASGAIVCLTLTDTKHAFMTSYLSIWTARHCSLYPFVACVDCCHIN